MVIELAVPVEVRVSEDRVTGVEGMVQASHSANVVWLIGEQTRKGTPASAQTNGQHGSGGVGQAEAEGKDVHVDGRDDAAGGGGDWDVAVVWSGTSRRREKGRVRCVAVIDSMV